MSEYEFIFVVSGISLEDDVSAETLTTEFDALLTSHLGTPRMTVTGEGPNAVTASIAVATRASELVEGLRFHRVDRDLVGVSDIAERTGRSRQNVDQWARHERRPNGPFPAPEGTVGTSLVWLWADVNEWLRPLGLDDGEQRPTREEMNRIDLFLPYTRHLSTRLEDGSAGEGVDVSSLNVEVQLVRSPRRRVSSAYARALSRSGLYQAGEDTEDEVFLRL